jgi:hypothetical protein
LAVSHATCTPSAIAPSAVPTARCDDGAASMTSGKLAGLTLVALRSPAHPRCAQTNKQTHHCRARPPAPARRPVEWRCRGSTTRRVLMCCGVRMHTATASLAEAVRRRCARQARRCIAAAWRAACGTEQTPSLRTGAFTQPGCARWRPPPIPPRVSAPGMQRTRGMQRPPGMQRPRGMQRTPFPPNAQPSGGGARAAARCVALLRARRWDERRRGTALGSECGHW